MDIEYVDIVQDIMGNGNILASWEKHFIRVCENLTQYPCILISVDICKDAILQLWNNYTAQLEIYFAVTNAFNAVVY